MSDYFSSGFEKKHATHNPDISLSDPETLKPNELNSEKAGFISAYAWTWTNSGESQDPVEVLSLA